MTDIMTSLQAVTEYAICYREFGDHYDIIKVTDSVEDADAWCAELAAERGINARVITRKVTAWVTLPRPGETVRYTGARVRDHGEYVVAHACRCAPHRPEACVDRFVINRAGGRGLSHVHASALTIVSDR